jgi:hypothetical protein
MARRGIPVFQYDHTISAAPETHALLTGEPVGLGPVADPEARLDTLANLVSRNGHDAATNLILKCDIEGAEWDILPVMPSAVLRRFSQIVIEIHDLYKLADEDVGEIMRASVAKLTAHHAVVHVHANNSGQWALVGGLAAPNVLEITMARKDLARLSVSDEVFPTSLDMPNGPMMADYYLGRFAFD